MTTLSQRFTSFEQRKAAAIAILRAGYDPEQEPGPRRSDANQAACGWRDRLAEHAVSGADPEVDNG